MMTCKRFTLAFCLLLFVFLIAGVALEVFSGPGDNHLHIEHDYLPVGHQAHTHDHGGSGCCPCGVCHDDEHEYTGELPFYMQLIAGGMAIIFLASKLISLFI